MTDDVSRTIPALPLVASVCALLAIVGSMGPWARALFVTKNGTDGDGVLTLLLGIAALVVSGVRTARPDQWRRAGWVAVVSFGLAALIGAYDWSNVSDVAGQTGGLVEVGWGLVVMTLAAVAGGVCALIDMVRARQAAGAFAPAGYGVSATAPVPAAIDRGPAGAAERTAHFCGACGAGLKRGARFCDSCGAPTPA